MKFSLGNGNGDYVIILYDEEEKEYFFKYKGERFSAKTEKELWKKANELGFYTMN